MNNELERFFKSINYEADAASWSGASVAKVILKKKSDSFEVHIKLPRPIEPQLTVNLFTCASHGLGGKDLKIILEYDEILEEDQMTYLKYMLESLVKKRPSLMGILESPITFDGEIAMIEVGSKTEEAELKREIKGLVKGLNEFGFSDFYITITLNKEKEASIKEELKKEVVEEVTPAPKSDVFLGKHIDGELTTISSIIGDIRNIIVEVYVFGIDTLEKENINIMTLKISDRTNSILAKIFKKDKEDFESIKKEVKEGKWYRIHGNVEFDNFSKELVLSVRNMEHIKEKASSKCDDAEEKRIELHAHTFASTMDGVIAPKSLVQYAIGLGHHAVAVTDHNSAQAYPEIYKFLKGYNKGKEDADKFKAIYGTEMNVVSNDMDIVYHPKEYKLLDETFVVFDTETTGFYVGSDQMIEIGAVKIKNGEIIDQFDELIDPGRPLPRKITELTNITDEMLRGKDNEENVTKRFLSWAGDAPMVAHNAKFDIGFVESAVAKYHLPEFTNTVLDTMGMARMLYPDWPNHKLSTLVKRLKVEWNEDEHHRADYDAAGTAKAFYSMCKTMYDRNIETTLDIDSNMDEESLVKFARPFHISILVKNREGLKNLFKIISIANTKYLYKNDQPKIPRKELIKYHEGLLFGSGCINGEIFEAAKTKDDEELSNMMRFYDYIEVQPIKACTHLLQMESSGFHSEEELASHLAKIVRVAKEAGKPVCATGDVHHLTTEDKIYREIIINQKTNGKLHPLNRRGITVPDMSFLTTEEMLEQFSFLDEDVRKEIVITNPKKIADQIEHYEVIIETGGIPFSPRIDNSIETVIQLVFDKASSWYGDPLPYNIEERIAKELYGGSLYEAVADEVSSEGKFEGEEKIKEIFARLHATIIGGDEPVKKMVSKYFKKQNPEMDDEEIKKLVKSKLGGVIGGGFDVIYLIAQKLVKHSNDDGYLVGSRGSVGSSFVATLMGITEVNALPAHYLCRDCKHSEFTDELGEALVKSYASGYDLPDKACPLCGKKMDKEGQDMPFETFLGFNADKVPDIDLNFSGEYQWKAHEYTKVLFGVDNVYRAGTTGTVAEKTAYGYVKGYLEEKGISGMRNVEIERLAKGCTGVKRTSGQHPGGIVVIPGYMDVYDFTPVQYPADDPTSLWRTTHFDYHSIEECVLKLDILGHDDPTMLRMLQDLSGIDVTTLPFDDPEVYKILKSPKVFGVTEDEILCPTGTLGIPELGTKFTIQMLVDTKPDTFADLVKISGLSHGTDVWAGNASELVKNKVVPFKEVIGCRDDIMVNLIAWGMEPKRAFKIMEHVRKGKAKKDPETWAGMVEDMKKANIPEWYIDSCYKIQYMFPKAHAVAYVMSALRIAWFKVHQPINYYAAYFSIRVDDFDIETMIKGYDDIRAKVMEIKAKGYDASNKEANVLDTLQVALEASARKIKFANINIEKSDATHFIIDTEHENTLIPPFSTIDGLGDTVAKNIIEERNKKPFFSIEDLQMRGKISATTIEKLRSMGVLDGMPETSQLSLF